MDNNDLVYLNIKDCEDYFINKQGQIFKKKKKGLVEVKQYKADYNFVKVNIRTVKGKQTTKLVHVLVYETYKGKKYSNIHFIDGDKNNCRLDNLVSTEDLIEFYRNNINK